MDVEPSSIVNEGNSVAFYCNVNGTQPLSFSWYKDNSLLNIKEFMFIKSNLKRGDAGGYYCVVSNSNGSSTSAVKPLKVQCKRDSLVAVICSNSSTVFVLVILLNMFACFCLRKIKFIQIVIDWIGLFLRFFLLCEMESHHSLASWIFSSGWKCSYN